MPRTRFKVLGPDELAKDGNYVGPVQGDGADVEDAEDRGVRAKRDEVDCDAPEYGDPDGIYRRAGSAVDDGPDLAARDQAVAGEGEEGSGERLGGGEADELEDD